ncbi:MAG: hypothetical protein HDT27_01760 [Subdoligranulum sp.]|nr:hypothetical protein [Subdoligranulum sp.]
MRSNGKTRDATELVTVMGIDPEQINNCTFDFEFSSHSKACSYNLVK